MTMAIFRDSAGSLPILITLFCTIVAQFITILHAGIGRPWNPRCNAANYTEGSQFESNFNTLFNRLVQHTPETGFNTSEYGQSPYETYGLLQCRADTTSDECYNCSQQATASIRQGCGNAIGGSLWQFDCFFRYENYSFIGKLDTNGWYTHRTGNASNSDVFAVAVEKLLSNLSAEASSGSGIKQSAFGTALDSLFRRIYAQVQCTRDISANDCSTCLSNTINHILVVYPGNMGVQGLMESCIIRYEIYPFFNSTALSPHPAQAPVNPVANITSPRQITPASSNNRTQIHRSGLNSSNKIPIILGVVGGLLLVFAVCQIATWRRLKAAVFRTAYEGDGEDTLISEDHQIVFTMETLLAATDNFHDDNKLGEGGFGPVYKGTTQDGKKIAVKKLSLNSMQGKEEFLNEVKLVAKIQHRNLVNLLGCCAEGSERLLVYEYLPNKSLDKILFDPNTRRRLDWQKRYNIVKGVARGLLYLHQDSQLRIIHRDIKASNILLDEKLNPKIADFGLAKLFQEDQSHVSTRVAGTYGYMAPEYALQGQLSVKADVYSFGVLVLELIAGRKNTDYDLSSEMQMLLGWAWRSYKQGNIAQMIDPVIIETCDEEKALRIVHVGLLCTQADSSLRPEMSAVNLMLSSHSVTLPNPTKPALVRTYVSGSSNASGLSHASAGSSQTAAMVVPPSNADVGTQIL